MIIAFNLKNLKKKHLNIQIYDLNNFNSLN